jgi:hypothetical protein
MSCIGSGYFCEQWATVEEDFHGWLVDCRFAGWVELVKVIWGRGGSDLVLGFAGMG